MLKRFILPASFIITAAVLLLPGCSAEDEVDLRLAADEGGTVSGEGLYEEGEEVTVQAEAEEGYEFIAWLEDGEKVSEQEEYNFTVDRNRELIAKFEIREEVTKEQGEEEPEGSAGEIIIESQRSGRRLVVSPDGKFLLTKEAELPERPVYPIYNLDDYIEETDGGEKLNDKLPEDFDAVELLPVPEAEGYVHIHHPTFTPDGDKLLYVGYEYMDRATIYFSHVGLPPKVFHRLEVDSGHTIKPSWKANQEGIYYITEEGLFSYLLEEEEEPSMLHSSSELEGFPGTTNYTFNISSDYAELAWYYEGNLKILDLTTDRYDPEVIETEIDMESTEVSYIFEGKYIALSLVEDSLTLMARETGEFTEIDYKYKMTDYLNTYAWNDLSQLAVLQETDNSARGLQLTLYNEELEKIRSKDVPRNSSEVVWLGDSWGVLERNRNSFKVHAINFISE